MEQFSQALAESLYRNLPQAAVLAAPQANFDQLGRPGGTPFEFLSLEHVEDPVFCRLSVEPETHEPEHRVCNIGLRQSRRAQVPHRIWIGSLRAFEAKRGKHDVDAIAQLEDHPLRELLAHAFDFLDRFQVAFGDGTRHLARAERAQSLKRDRRAHARDREQEPEELPLPFRGERIEAHLFLSHVEVSEEKDIPRAANAFEGRKRNSQLEADAVRLDDSGRWRQLVQQSPQVMDHAGWTPSERSDVSDRQ